MGTLIADEKRRRNVGFCVARSPHRSEAGMFVVRPYAFCFEVVGWSNLRSQPAGLCVSPRARRLERTPVAPSLEPPILSVADVLLWDLRAPPAQLEQI
ncbi:Dihydroorotase [Frankliniella fusca]|uniref:Dihydroorotase n=1 Tax=Frankliniella fusca TaxID=407009 RepID=A0AAE1HPU8_9NEOP|nr:Dihydroorotase [Frankliniella fusca]